VLRVKITWCSAVAPVTSAIVRRACSYAVVLTAEA
jgi:hypothetical protein